MERRLVIPKTARSDVWQYFGFEADEYGTIVDKRCVWCRLCNSQVLFSGNTTNLSAHIVKCRLRYAHCSKLQIEQHTLPEVRKISKKTPEVPNFVEAEEDTLDTEDTSSILASVSVNDEVFLLEWKNHKDNQQSKFCKLLEQEAFCDVTLACEDGLLSAHKLVLASCSPYFEMILLKHYEKHPIIVLKDIKYCDMSLLLQFMYNGEVNVEQSQLKSVLSLAKSLKLYGLAVDIDLSEQSINEDLLETLLENDSPAVDVKRKRKNTDLTPTNAKSSRPSVESPYSFTLPKMVNDTLQPQCSSNDKLKKYRQGVIPLPEYLKLNEGRSGKFWREPFVIRILEGIRDYNLRLEDGARILNISYSTLYQHFRSRYGKLKTKVVWSDPDMNTKEESEESLEAAGSEQDEQDQSEIHVQDSSNIFQVATYSSATQLIDETRCIMEIVDDDSTEQLASGNDSLKAPNC